MTGTYAGKNAFMLFKTESTFNQAAGTIDKDIGVIGSTSPEFNNNLESVNEIGDREPVDIEVGAFTGNMSVEGVLNSGAVLELFFGQATDNTSTTDTQHIFIDKDNDEGQGAITLPNTVSSFSITENFSASSDIQYTHTGCKINDLEISIDQNGRLSYSADIIMSSVSTGTSVGTQSSTTTQKLSGYNATLSTGDQGSESSVAKVQNATINLSHNIDENEVNELGSREHADLVENQFTGTIEVTAKFDSKTQFERFLGGSSPQTNPTDTSVILDVDNGVALDSGKVQFYIELEGGQYESHSQPVETESAIEQTFTIRKGKINKCYFTDAVSDYAL